MTGMLAMVPSIVIMLLWGQNRNRTQTLNKTDLLTSDGHIRTETLQLNRFAEHPQSAWGQNRNRIQTLNKPDLLTPDGYYRTETLSLNLGRGKDPKEVLGSPRKS